MSQHDPLVERGHVLIAYALLRLQVSSDVWRVHCVHGGEPVVLFQRGAVRLLDSLLSAPQQPIEEVLAPEEAIRSVLLYVAVAARFKIVF